MPGRIRLAILALAVLSCTTTVRVETPHPTVTVSQDSLRDAEIWRFSLSEVEAEARNGQARLMLGATIVVPRSPSAPPAAQLDLAVADLLDVTAYDEWSPLASGDPVMIFLPGDTLTVGTTLLGAVHLSDETVIYTSPVLVDLEDFASVALADSVTGRIGSQYRPAFTLRMARHHLEGMRELFLRSGAADWLEDSRAAAERAATISIMVRDSTRDEWNGISEWWLEGPEVPSGEAGLHLSTATRIRVVDARDRDQGNRCGLQLALRRDDGWARADFQEDRSGELYQEIQIQVDGTRVPESDLVVHPDNSLESPSEVVPIDVVTHWDPDSAWFLAVVSDASIVRMRIGDREPFQLSQEAMDLLLALRERTASYGSQSGAFLSEWRAYCPLGTQGRRVGDR